VSRSTRLETVPFDRLDHDDADEAEQTLLAEHIVSYRIDGPLFFTAAHRFLLQLSDVAYIRVVILRLSRITALDATGAKVLGDAITRLEWRGILVLLSGIKPDHDDILTTLGIAEHLRRDGLIFPDTPTAIRHARSVIGVLPGAA
jgi:SulP family sulfate permease